LYSFSLAMKKLLLLISLVLVITYVLLLVNKSLPFSDRDELYSTEISIDSVITLGPAAALYDSASQAYYWLKSYSSFDQSALDTLKGKTASIRYMKFLKGPLENRVFRIEVDSVIVFDQVIERE